MKGSWHAKTHLDRDSPNIDVVQSQSISPFVPRLLDCSARDFRRSVSASDHVP